MTTATTRATDHPSFVQIGQKLDEHEGLNHTIPPKTPPTYIHNGTKHPKNQIITFCGDSYRFRADSPFHLEDSKISFSGSFLFLLLPEDLLCSNKSTLFNVIKRVKPTFVKSLSLRVVCLQQSREPPLLLAISKKGEHGSWLIFSLLTR